MHLKEICEGLPPWGHVIVWILVIIFHFVSRNQAKKKVLKQIFGDEEKQKETEMEVAKGVKVDLEKGDLVIRVSL